jgi:hypothetical protein
MESLLYMNVARHVRHLVSQTGHGRGWAVYSDNRWHFEPLSVVRPVLAALRVPPGEIEAMLGKLALEPWVLDPAAQREYPGGRRWNPARGRVAQAPGARCATRP